MTHEKLDLDILLNEAKSAANLAGAFMQEQLHSIHAQDIEKKGVNNLVSYVDKNCEELIVNCLSKALPEAGFITEENTRTDSDKEYCWVIDPLDGTTNYLHKLPAYSVSIALLHNKLPLAGVVFDVTRNDMYSAISGKGAFLNDKPIQVSQVSTLQNSLLATGFPYTFYEYIDKFINLFKHLLQRCQGLRRFGSAALDLCYVACGRFEAFYEYKLNAWDVAAGVLIVQEAGGKVTDFNSGDGFIFDGSLVASNGLVHLELIEEIGKYF